VARGSGRRGRPATETCPQCGAEFKAGRLACPECGSDSNTGWKDAEEIDYQSLDLSSADDVEFDPATGLGRRRSPRWILIAAVLALTGFVLVYVLGALA
jgi:uncharacterized membrane protein YvbJ